MIERRPMSAGYDWLAERLQYINGSEIGTVCGARRTIRREERPAPADD
jgi:hypothetical protein